MELQRENSMKRATRLLKLVFYFKQRVTAPSRLAGNVLLVHETLNQVKEPRLAWLYNAGQRRVRGLCIPCDALSHTQHRRLRLQLKFSRHRWAAVK